MGGWEASRRVVAGAVGLTATVGLTLGATAGPAGRDGTLSFNRDVRPILSQNCFACHGPDRLQRKANLRLDVAERRLDVRGGRSVTSPGQPAKSELVRRITAADQRRMPPRNHGSGRPLSTTEIAVLQRWVAEGARWEQHWSLIPPRRAAVPRTRQGGWIKNPVDAFVLERLERAGLQPMPEAERATLLRRVSLDLTGLPPTPEETTAFVQDPSADAYEKVVDRLLASPRYGERMAARWLDAARYADTNGYQTDGERHMWRWRDWVIEAFHHDLPFDQFTIQQLAGDLLPKPTLEQRIATGFNRNYRGNGEGGIIPEEYLVEYAVDRTDTVATVWLGWTAGCARCHDHKFDPLTQKEYYRLLAFFNNLPEKGRANKYGNSPPLIPAPTAEQQAELAALERRLAAREQQLRDAEERVRSAQSAWESAAGRGATEWLPDEALAARFALDGKDSKATLRDGAGVTAAGPTGSALSLNGRGYLDGGDVAKFTFQDRFSAAIWVYPEGDGTLLSRMTDEPRGDGYSLTLAGGRLQTNFVKRWLDDSLRLESEQPLPHGRWSHVAFTYDGTRQATGVVLYVNGNPVRLKVLLDELNQSFDTEQPLRIGAGGGPAARFRGRLAEARVFGRVLAPEEVGWLAVDAPLARLAALPPVARTPTQAGKLRAAFLHREGPEEFRSLAREVRELRRRREALIDSFPTVMVMEEMTPPRQTFVLQRGVYDRPGERVGAGLPLALPPLPQGSKPDRLALARWLVSRENPLTSRVAVNRLWQMLFGRGLVRTVEDFGSQGEWPSHPELLDWLAVELQQGWSLKKLLRTLVTSATYRQSSQVTPDRLRKDPENRLYSRAPRLRLPAEMVRDQALFAGGLLVEKLGGPSVRPYQPPGLWKELAGGLDYTQDRGENLYRRSLYTFWKRTSPPPALSTFDAAGRETCIVRETRTNTPLQALNLMNDVTYVEAARALAQRVLRGPAATPRARLTELFHRVLARTPRPAELGVLEAGLTAQLARFREDPTAGKRLLAHGESPMDPTLDPAEHAAYAAVASLVLNLDEAVTRE